MNINTSSSTSLINRPPITFIISNRTTHLLLLNWFLHHWWSWMEFHLLLFQLKVWLFMGSFHRLSVIWLFWNIFCIILLSCLRVTLLFMLLFRRRSSIILIPISSKRISSSFSYFLLSYFSHFSHSLLKFKMFFSPFSCLFWTKLFSNTLIHFFLSLFNPRNIWFWPYAYWFMFSYSVWIESSTTFSTLKN